MDPLFDDQGWRYVRVAVDGVPTIPFAFHKSVYDLYPTDAAFEAYLARQGRAMIERGLVKNRVDEREPSVN